MDDLEDIVLDEIALEGLSGVSLERLWLLLEQRQAPFPLKCDDHTRNFIWQELLCQHQTISFYTVPDEFQQLNESVVEEKTPAKKPRRPRTKHQTNETLIDDPQTKDRGYCRGYKQRKDVTAEIRKGTGSDCLSLQQVTIKYGNSLVLVASQEARLHALISQVTSADVPLQTLQYCCLEHLGRCRYRGASQPNLSVKFDIDLSYVFHMCKILLTLGVVMKETTENLAHIYLIRFKPQSQVTRKTRIADKIMDYLGNQPNKMAPRYELVEHVLKSEEEDVSYSQFKKALHDLKLSKTVEAVSIVAKELPQFSCPEVKQSLSDHLRIIKAEEGESANTGRKPEDFIITCIRLMEQSSIADDGVEDNDDDDADLDLKGINAVEEIDFSRLSLNLELTDTQQVYYYVEKNQNEMKGVSINKAMHALMMDRYRVRIILKRLARKQLMKSFTFMSGRSREMRFFTQRGLDEGTVPEQILQMYHQGGKKPPITKQTPVKAEDTSSIPSSSEAGGSSDHLESSPGVSQQTGKAKKISQDTEPAGRSKGVTQAWKNLERSRLILEHIAFVRVIELHVLLKHIKKTEAEMGSKTECCRKSLFRMIQNLAKEGKLNYFTKEVQRKERSKKESIKLVSDPSIGDNDPQVLSVLDKIIIKPHFVPQPVKMPVLYRKLKGKPGNKALAMSDILKSKMQHTYEKRKIMERYGYTGKMDRLEALHKFLWYLLYESEEGKEVKLEPIETLSAEANETSTMSPGWKDHKTGQADIVVAQSIKSVTMTDKKGKTSKDESSLTEESPRTHVKCYVDTTDPSDWRRYVPPGQGHVGRLKGWATMNDILSNLPLSLFVKTNSILQPVGGLDETLEHPRMRHYPINILRLHLFHGCDIKRTMNNLHNCLVALSGMGLVYFDRDQKNQLRNQANFYLCRSGSFLDTTSSAPGNDQVQDKEYPKRTYKFTSLENVAQFWLDFKMTCFSTPLGVIKKQSSKVIKENKILIMVADSIHEAPPDPIDIPGDHRGAGGLDTSFFAHRSGNWDKIKCKSTTVRKTSKMEFVTKSESDNEAEGKGLDLFSDKKEVKRITVSAKEHKKATAGGKGQKRKTSKGKSKAQKEQAGEESMSASGLTNSGPVEGVIRDNSMVEITNQEGKKPKNIRPKPKSKTHLVRNLHIYDDEDLLASQRKILRRVKWSAREDNLLLLCGLCLRILRVKCAKSDTVKRFVSWAVIRDILQENLEESFDKTAAAAARRFRLLLKDYTNMSNFSVCLTDIHSDKEIMTEFMSRNRDYEDEAVRQQEFRELCMTLAKKFESQDKSEILVLPSTLEELYEKYDLMNSSLPVATTLEDFESRDVTSEEEITCSILSKIVLISMLSHHFRQHDMREIYYALIQYDQTLLQKAVDLFKSHGFMGRNRNAMLDTVNTKRAMHVVPMSFQFTKTFFNLFNAPSVPSKVLDETSTILGDILTACKQDSGQTSSDGNGEEAAPTVCIDDLRGNKSSILCIPALELASDSVDIPKDIISLELSPSERVHLQKKHEEEMMREVEEGDLDEEDDDDSLSEKPKETKRKAPEISEDVAPRKMMRQLVGDIARKKVAFVRTAHQEWRQSQADKQASELENTKGRMSSLIPRLLVNMDKQKTDVDSSGSKPSKEPVANDSTASAKRSLALDHDYFIHEENKAPETFQDENHSEALCQLSPGEAATTPENITHVDNAFSSCKVASENGASKAVKASDSFFTWLTMRGFLTQDYSKKPQNIHEDITVRRCSVHLKPKACLLQILDKYHMSSKQKPHEPEQLHDPKIPADVTSERPGSQSRNSASEGQYKDTEVNLGGQDSRCIPTSSSIASSEGKLISHENISCLSWHSESKSRTMRTITPGHVQSLGELVYQPCGPIQAFQCPTPNSNLRPSLEYTIRESCRSLEDICKGHKYSELLRNIYQHVKTRGSLGLTYPQLFDALGPYSQHSKSRVFNCLRILLQEQLILEVGTTVVRLVAKECASKWLLKSVKSVPIITPPGSTGLISPAKKAKVSEKSISQGGMTNSNHTVSDILQKERDGEEETLPAKQVVSPSSMDTDERLQGASITSGGERSRIENDKKVSGKDGSADVMATDEDVSNLASWSRGKKRKKADKKERIHPEARHEPVTILSHPWTNIDGSVSAKSLTMFISSLGLLVISKPGIKESEIFHHFQNAMAPVEILHLIKILLNADIISRHSTYSSVKLNLFGPPSNTKPKPVVFYQPSVGALMNLALLKDNLAQSKVEGS